MRHFLLVLSFLFVISAKYCFSQTTDKNSSADMERIEFIAISFLNSVTIDTCNFSSAFIYPESLVKSKDMFISILKESSEKGKLMGIISLDSLQSMTPAQVYDYTILTGKRYMKSEGIPKPEWTVRGVEFKDDTALLTYEVKDRGQKIMKFKKDNNEWKMILSFESIF